MESHFATARKMQLEEVVACLSSVWKEVFARTKKGPEVATRTRKRLEVAKKRQEVEQVQEIHPPAQES